MNASVAVAVAVAVAESTAGIGLGRAVASTIACGGVVAVVAVDGRGGVGGSVVGGGSVTVVGTASDVVGHAGVVGDGVVGSGVVGRSVFVAVALY